MAAITIQLSDTMLAALGRGESVSVQINSSLPDDAMTPIQSRTFEPLVNGDGERVVSPYRDLFDALLVSKPLQVLVSCPGWLESTEVQALVRANMSETDPNYDNVGKPIILFALEHCPEKLGELLDEIATRFPQMALRHASALLSPERARAICESYPAAFLACLGSGPGDE